MEEETKPEKSLLDHLDLLERSAKASTSDSIEVMAAARALRALINFHESTDKFTEALRETTRAADSLRAVLRQVKQNGVLDRKPRSGDLS